MTELSYSQARSRTESYVEYNGIKHHMYHSPSDKYWTTPIRILFVNLESYGYDGINYVDKYMLLDWCNDAGDTNTRTVKYSLTFYSTLLAAIRSATPIPDPELVDTLRRNYRNKELLEDSLEHICYYNIMPISNPGKRPDYKAIAEFIASERSKYIADELRALDPRVAIISGRAVLNISQNLGLIPADFKFQEVRKINNTIYMSIRHPAYPRYKPWAEAISSSATIMAATAR